MSTADETQLGWCWYKGAGSISIHQPHVFRLFLDLNSNQFPAVGLFESHVTFDQWASRPGPFPRLDNVRKTWWTRAEITPQLFVGWRVVVFAPDWTKIYIAEDSTSANGTHDTSIAVLRDISENS